jgi:flotillin
MTTLAYVILGIVIGGLLLLVLLFRAAWRVAEPDEALIVSGFRTSQRPDGVGESMGFRIVTGRGCLVAPGITRVRRLSLEAHESEIGVPCVSQQKIRVDLRGVIVYKVGDDYRSIANAARRFLDRPAAELETKVQNVFVGHLRAIAGSMTVEDMISDQDKFAQQVRDRCSQEMESFGLVIDSFQIQSITSPSNYIENLAAPHQAEVEQNARIARANSERAAVSQEQIAQAQMAESEREHQESRLPGRGRHRNPARRAARTSLRGEGPPGRRHGADARRRTAGAAEGTAAPGGRPPSG